MTRLMCSNDRKEIEELKSKLFRAGIRSEVSSNPLASALGVTRLEIHIHDADFMDASRIHQHFLATRNNGGASNGAERNSADNPAKREEVEVVVEPEQRAPMPAQLGAPGQLQPAATGPQENSGIELAKAAVLLEKEVEEVLARDHQLAQRCAALQDQVKALDNSLAQVHTELARESSERTAAQQKLADAGAGRVALEKEMESLNLRLKGAEQAVAEANGRIEQQSRELKLEQAKASDLSKEVTSRDSQIGGLVEALSKSGAALESEKGLRQAAEQQLSEHAAARKALEQKLNDFAVLHAQLKEQTQRDREHIQACIEAVNKLRGRLSQDRSGTP